MAQRTSIRVVRVAVGGYPVGVPDLNGKGMFLFFSNRLGCLGSLALSLGLTLVLVWVLSR